jgi:hypothetical protein
MEYKLINTDYIESVAGGDMEIIKELVNIFSSQIDEFSMEMRTLNEKVQYYQLGLLAHKAKSSVAIMGMEGLATMLKTFELEAKENRNTEKYAGYISRFESDTREALRELENYINSH